MRGGEDIKVTYQEAENIDQQEVDDIFDILFNEVVRLDNLGKSAAESRE